MEWINDIAEGVSGAFVGAATYLNENEWAANALTGAATAGAGYLVQKDQQKATRRESDKAWERKVSLSQAPDIDMNQYDWSDLSNGSLTDGGLIAGGMNK